MSDCLFNLVASNYGQLAKRCNKKQWGSLKLGAPHTAPDSDGNNGAPISGPARF